MAGSISTLLLTRFRPIRHSRICKSSSKGKKATAITHSSDDLKNVSTLNSDWWQYCYWTNQSETNPSLASYWGWDFKISLKGQAGFEWKSRIILGLNLAKLGISRWTWILANLIRNLMHCIFHSSNLPGPVTNWSGTKVLSILVMSYWKSF